MSPYNFLGLMAGIIIFNIPPTLSLLTVGFILTNIFHLLLSYSFGVILVSVIMMTFGTFLSKYLVGGKE